MQCPRRLHWNRGPAGGEATEGIGPAATVDVYEVRLDLPNQPPESTDEAEVEVAGHRHGDGVQPPVPGRHRDFTVAGTYEGAIDPEIREPLDQIEDLARSTIQMSSGFEMQDANNDNLKRASGPYLAFRSA